jgi:hypothetical protein
MMVHQPGYCPITGTKGKQVDGATVKSLVSISLRQIRDVPYYFCREPECDVVYFSEDGQQTIHTHEVRERVYQKEPDNLDVLICYCFRHTTGDLKRDIEAAGGTSIVDDISAGIRAGQCACDWRNPQGDCCLGNVNRLIKRFLAEKKASSL